MAEFNHSAKRKKNRLNAPTSGSSKKNKANERVVEKILDKRKFEGHTELLLKWKNLPPEQSTWVPIDTLGEENIQLLTDFNNSYQRSKGKVANPPPTKAQPTIVPSTKENARKPITHQPVPKKSVTKEHVQPPKAQPVVVLSSPSPSNDADSSDSTSSSDSSSSSDSTNETSSSDDEADELENKPPISHSANNIKQSGYTVNNQFKATENQGLTNFGLGHVRDLLSSDDSDDDEPAEKRPAAKLSTNCPNDNPTLESVKDQPENLKQIRKNKQPEAAAEPTATSTQRRKTVHGSNADRRVEKVETARPRRSSLERHNRSAVQSHHLERHEEQKPFETVEPAEEGAATFSDFGRWDECLTVPTQVYGVEMGLTLEKILKSFKIKGETYLVAKWRDRATPDAVKLKKLVALYPHLVIEYFERLEMRTVE
ncbi:hypothetical protein KR044_012729 [Drosophila immigrans]|nr:hypothetical protein KR044_012729 [Drosophila immigrans]